MNVTNYENLKIWLMNGIVYFLWAEQIHVSEK